MPFSHAVAGARATARPGLRSRSAWRHARPPPGPWPSDPASVAGWRPRAGSAGRSSVQSTTVEAGPPWMGPPSMTSATASPSRAAISTRVTGVRLARDVRGRRRQRPEGAGQRAWRGVVRHADPDRGRAGGEDARQRDPRHGPAAPASGRRARTARPGRRAAGPMRPTVDACPTSASRTATAFSGGRRLAAKRRSMASGRAMSAAIPYTVSVGRATIRPTRRSDTASARAASPSGRIRDGDAGSVTRRSPRPGRRGASAPPRPGGRHCARPRPAARGPAPR